MPNTPNHGFNLPTVGADSDSWGTENNGAHNAWDALLSGAQNTYMGRVASGSGPMKQLTAAEAASGLPAVIGDSGSGGTKGLVPAPAAADAAARKTLAASGAWLLPDIRALGQFNGTTGATVVARGLSVSRTGTGEYTVTLSPAMADTNYIIIPFAETVNLSAGLPAVTFKTASTFQLSTSRYLPGGTTIAPYDPTVLNIAVLVI